MSIVRNVWDGVKLGDIAEWLEDVWSFRSPESPPMKTGGRKVNRNDIYKLYANYG